MGKVNAFIESLDGKSELTKRNYLSRLSDIELALGDLTKLSGPELKEYFRELKGKNVRPSTVNAKISALRAFYKWAIEKNYISENPALYNLRHEPNPSSKKLSILPVIQVDYMLEAAKDNLRDYVILLFMLNTASRRSEVVQVTINEFEQAVRNGMIILHGKGKNGGKDEEVSFVEKKTISLIKKYLKERTDNCDYLFVNKFGRQMTGKSIENIVKKYMLLANAKWHKKCTIDESMMHPHVLRHTAIFEFWRRTKDPKATMNFARHDSFATTLIYMDQTDYGEQSVGVGSFSWNN